MRATAESPAYAAASKFLDQMYPEHGEVDSIINSNKLKLIDNDR